MSDIYGGHDPREIPAYTIAQAAYYLRVNQGTLRHWVRGGTYPTSDGPKRAKPVITIARSRRPLGLSFFNLVEVHVLRALRTSEDIPLQRIRPALKYVEEQLGTKHPLVNEKFMTDGLNLFVERYGQIINASKGGRIEMRQALQDTLRRIERDDKGVASGYFLWARDPLEEKKVIVDPKVSFGKAVLTGTGIPIITLAERVRAGDEIDAVADDYGVDAEDVEYALRWEPLVAAA
jgi:uncharacterized protein (DUF433 family)